MGVGPQGDTECPSETEIRQFQVAFLVDQEILRLEITVENTVGVAVPDTGYQLVHELLDNVRAHARVGHVAVGQLLATSALADRESLHVLLQVEVEIFENEVELVAIGVHDVEEADNVRVIHLLEQRDFADGGGGHAFIFGLKTNLLESNDALVLGGKIASLVHNTVGTCKSKPSVELRHARGNRA